MLWWEIFNEPNLAVEWGDNLNPAYYVQMLMASSQAIKQIAPDVMVISAGLAPTNGDGEIAISLPRKEPVTEVGGRIREARGKANWSGDLDAMRRD